MSSPTQTTNPPARTHAEAAALFRRPFAPGAIGFRAMSKVPLGGQPYAGAQVAAYLGAQSVVQRLNTVVPGRWRQQFQSVPAEFVPPVPGASTSPAGLSSPSPSRRVDPISMPSMRTSVRWIQARSPG